MVSEERRRHPLDVEALHRIIEQQERVIARLSINETFGCLTRQALDVLLEELALDGLAAVFWDIDQLKEANTRWGKAESSRRIKEAIQARVTDCVAGQVWSGDEFIAFLQPVDAVDMAYRILGRLQDLGMSATFCVMLPQPGETPQALLVRADEVCSVFKDAGLRGRVHVIDA